MSAKPHLRSINGQLVEAPRAGRETPIEAARRRFGRAFAHEKGSSWEPKSTRLLTEWLAKRVTGGGNS